MKVVIAGGGFGGVRTALKLANKSGIEVKLLSGQSYFEYHAALYRSATGRSPLEVAIPLKDFFAYAKNIEVVDDKLNQLDSASKTAIGVDGSKYTYDALVLALGSVTEYYGIKGLEKYSYGVKTIHEALELKRHIHEQMVKGKADTDYAVIGAGATGVELAAELQAYLKAVRKRHKIKSKFKVHLIEAGPRVVSMLPERFSSAVHKHLTKLGVKVYLNMPVKAETAQSIVLPTGEVKTQTVIWTAGVANNPFFKQYPDIFKLGKGGRVEVDAYLQAAKDTYVIGDSAQTKFSGMAQTALHNADAVGDNLLRRAHNRSPKKYEPKLPIYAIPVGPRWAAVLWGKVMILGFDGWSLRRFADLLLYLRFLPLRKALTTWKYGFTDDEACPICRR